MRKRIGRTKEAIDGGGKRRRLIWTVAGSILLHGAVFVLLFFALGYLGYQTAPDAAFLWLIYPAAALPAAFFAALFAAGRLPLRGVLSGLAYGLGFLLLHGVLLRLLAGGGGIRLFATLTAILLCTLIGAVSGKNIPPRH